MVEPEEKKMLKYFLHPLLSGIRQMKCGFINVLAQKLHRIRQFGLASTPRHVACNIEVAGEQGKIRNRKALQAQGLTKT